MPKTKAIAFILGVLTMSFLVGYLALAWREPAQTPPGGNVPAPLNVGLTTQSKEGKLIIGTNPGLTTGLIVQHGNVGIGTTAPGARLDVGVGASQCCAPQTPNISLAQASNITGQMSWLQFHNAGEAEAYIRLAGGGTGLRAGQRRLEIGDSQGVGTGLTVQGNVGIGTTRPGARLDVFDGDIIVGRPQAIHGTTHRQFILHGAWNNLYIAPRNDANTGWLWDRFVIRSNGNVGIGTTAPGALLHVADRFAAGGRNLMIGDDTFLSDIDVANTLGIYGNQDSTQGHIRLGSAGPVISGVGGNVGIGTMAPGVRLDVAGTGTVGIRYLKSGTRDARIQVGDPTRTWGLAVGWARGGDFSIIEEGVAGDRLYIQQGGNVGIGTASPTARLDVVGQIRIRGGTPGVGKVLTSNAAGLATWRYPTIRITLQFASRYSADLHSLRFHIGRFSICTIVGKIHRSVEYRHHHCSLWLDHTGYTIDVQNACCVVHCYSIQLVAN